MNGKVEKNYCQIIMQLNWWPGLSGRWYGLAFNREQIIPNLAISTIIPNFVP
jgi:ABC-type spermidine/putrescine transport system permease subunit II